MGKWNRRYMPRRRFRNYEYQDPPPSPPESYSTQAYISRGEDNGVPAWEIDYCHSVRVPWRKILASKNYIYCHPSMLNWDDSAGKEALQNAKQRYWAAINGLPCDNPLPNPDIYLDEINWNPYLDPELMKDLDLQAYNPDDMQESNKLETINEEEGCARTPWDTNQSSNDNPWECNPMQDTGHLKDNEQGWNKWDSGVNTNNPWEQSCSQLNAWQSGHETWGWPQGTDNTAVRREGWGRQENNSWTQNIEGPRNFTDSVYSRGNNYFTSSRGRGWRGNRSHYHPQHHQPQGWKDNNRIQSFGWRGSTEYNANEPNYWDSQGFNQGGRPSRGGYRKRESSVQHTSKFKSSRYHSNTYGNSLQF